MERGKKKKKKDKQSSGGVVVEPPSFYCNYCSRDISRIVRIRCAECRDFDLCLECFSVGVELDDHRSDHPYRVVDKLNFPIIEANWTAWEEIYLLEGIEYHGYGNWRHIAEYLVSKTPEEVQAHLTEFYVKAPGQLPDISTVRPAGTSVRLFEESRIEGESEPSLEAATATGATAEDGEGEKTDKGGGKGGSSKRLKQDKTKDPKKVQTPAEVAGFYAKREDFDTEWDNDAEKLIMTFQFDSETLPVERELWQAMLGIYNDKLAERRKRKRFIIERNLTEQRSHAPPADRRRRGPVERELLDRLKVFERFHSEAEHNILIDALHEEHRLRERIGQLQDWRRAGITTLADGEKLEESRLRREDAATRRAAAQALPAAPPSVASLSRTWVARYLQSDDNTDFQPMDLTDMEGVALLAPAEHGFCARTHIAPLVYANAKGLLVSQCLAEGSVSRADAQDLLGVRFLALDAAKADLVYAFCLHNDWISADPRRPAGPRR